MQSENRTPLRAGLYPPYSVGHAAGLAALRWHGYRSENRNLVFQTLQHTVGWPAVQWRQLDSAHNKRNLAEYEGYLELEPSYVQGLIALVALLLDDVSRLVKRVDPVR